MTVCSRVNITSIIILVLLILPLEVFAQGLSIKGTVRDTSGNPLIGANVLIMETNYGAATDDYGRFVINKLKPGRYTLEFSSVGYKPETLTGVYLKNSPIEVNVILKEKVIESQQVVVTAGKFAQKLSELPISADIIHADELAQKDITDLSQAMKYVPGVYMIEDQISIRGSSGYTRGAGTRVLLEIDGIPYYTGDTGEIIWEIIPVNDIQRVEIIKGAASALYGSSAIGGVINVITKNIPAKSSTFIKGEFGAYDKPAYSQWIWTQKLRTFNSLTVSHSDRFGNFGYTLSISRISDLSYKQNDVYKRYIGYFKGLYNFSPSSSITVFMNGLNQDHGNFLFWKDLNHALQPPDADQGQSVYSKRYMFGSVYKNVLSENLLLNIRASYYRSDWNDQTASRNNSLSNLFRLEIQTNATLSNNIILVSGIEGTKDGVSSNIFGDHNSYGFGAYSQVDFTVLKSLNANFGIRYDYSKLSDLAGLSSVSPKAGLNLKLSDNLTLRSSFGTGFRAPSLAETFTTTSASGITIVPNPELKPEKNWTFEVGANYQLNSIINLDAAVFQEEYYNLIEPGVTASGQAFSFNNVTRARIQGFEAGTNYSFLNNKVRLSINYTYLWARDLQQNVPLKYRPRNNVLAGLDYFLDHFDLGADFRYSSKVEEMDYELVSLGTIKDGRQHVEIKVLDLRAGYNFESMGVPARVYFNVKNVFNYNYVELIANPAPIRNYSLSTEFLF